MQPTSVFDNDSDLIDAQKNPVIPWHAKDGFVRNILKVREEFKLYRALQAVKVVIMGPTFAGKTKIGKQLALKYRIPHISIA
jgi:adenylate kinase